MPAEIHLLKCLLMPKSVTVIALLTIKHNKAAKLRVRSHERRNELKPV